MIKKKSNYYWILIAILQIGIIGNKLMGYDSYLLNIIVLSGALLFLYNRFYKQKVLVSTEMVLSGLIGIYASIVFLLQLVNANNFGSAVFGFTVAILSFLMFWKTSLQN